MTITQPDLKYFKSEEVSSASTNGGLQSMLTADEAVTGVKNNVWPNVSAAERTAGIILYRKLFCTPQSNTDDELVDPRIWNHSPTPGDDYIVAFEGTKTDTEATLSESRLYACGILQADITAGEAALTLTVENSAQTAAFEALDMVRISAQTSPEASGTWEDISCNSSTPLINGLNVTLYFATNLENSYTVAAGTVVSSLIESSSTSPSTGTIDVTSVSGSVDESGFPPELNNKGTVDEDLTVTFSSSTAFTVVGSRSGALGAGTVSGDFVATHPYNSAMLITLRAGFFSATGFLNLDTVEIPTIANNIPFWLKRIVPAGSSVLSGDYNISAYRGESA